MPWIVGPVICTCFVFLQETHRALREEFVHALYTKDSKVVKLPLSAMREVETHDSERLELKLLLPAICFAQARLPLPNLLVYCQ